METLVKTMKDVGLVLVIWSGLSGGGLTEKDVALLIKACLHLVATQPQVVDSPRLPPPVEMVEVADGVNVPIITEIIENETTESDVPDDTSGDTEADSTVPNTDLSQDETSVPPIETQPDSGLVSPSETPITDCEDGVCPIDPKPPEPPNESEDRYLVVVMKKDCSWCDITKDSINRLKLGSKVVYVEEDSNDWRGYVEKFKIVEFPSLFFVVKKGDLYYIQKRYTGIIPDITITNFFKK